MGGYRKKKRCRLSLFHLLWCWPSRPSMFKHSSRTAITDGGRVLAEALTVGPASLLRLFVMAMPIAPTVEMKRTATEAAVVVKLVAAAAAAAALMMASVATDSLAITLLLIQNLRATSWVDPMPKEDPSHGR